MPSLFSRSESPGPGRSSGLLRSYHKALFWRRLILASFFTVFVATMLYVIPWLPYGLSVDDYNSRITFLLILMLIGSLLAFAAVYLRDISNRVEQTMLTWKSVNDGLVDMRHREYFFDRVAIECSRSGATQEEFTIVTLRLPSAAFDDGARISRAIQALEPVVRDYDCLSSLGPHEIAVLAHGVGQANAAGLSQRLAQIAAGTLDSTVTQRVVAGHAVFDADASEAGSLIAIARERLMRSRQQAEAEAEVTDPGAEPLEDAVA